MALTAEPSLDAPAPELEPTPTRFEGLSPRQLFFREIKKDRLAIASFWFLVAMIAVSAGAPIVSRYVVHHSPSYPYINALNDFGNPTGPNGHFWFGVDNAGRDVFVRILYGARTSLFVAVFATGIAVAIGLTIGLVSGFYGGKVDTVLSRFTDIVMSLPVLLLALGLVAGCGLQQQGCLGGLIRPGLLLVSYVIALFTWPYISRLVRGEVFRLREREFVEAARAAGSTQTRIIVREILPNVVAPVLVFSTLLIPNNILFEAALSFLGIGVPPSTPSWGKMLADGSTIFTIAWWMMVFPGLFLFATTLAFNLLGDGMRDALDPRAHR